MSRLDDALREALRPQDPGPGFTARVLARAAAAPPPKQSWWWAWRWAAAGALASVLFVGGGLEYRHEQELRQGRLAKQQLMLALRIAGTKLNLALDRVEQSNNGD
jgi:hypothetical protein